MDPTIIELLQGGGNIALVVAVFFIYKAADRLSRIEKMLELVLMREQPEALRTLKDKQA